MKITQNELLAAAQASGVSDDAAQKLWVALEERAQWRPRFDLVHVLYYAGALIVILAMSVCLTTAWSNIGASALFVFAAAYAVFFLLLAEWMKNRPGLSVPTGLVATLAVAMVPLMIYALQEWLGLWPEGDAPGEYQNFYEWVRSMWLQMELWTLIAGAAVLWRYRYPFIVLPLAVMLWFVSMDVTPLIAGGYPDPADYASNEAYTKADAALWKLRQWVSLLFGLGMIALAYVTDRRTRLDYAFWLYMFGALAFWGALSSMDSDSELNKFLYAVINVALIGLGVFLGRRVFLVFGAMGVYAYLGHLALKIFEDSLLFPVVLVAFGLSVIGVGILLYRHGKTWEARLTSVLPSSLVRLRPQQRELAELDRP